MKIISSKQIEGVDSKVIDFDLTDNRHLLEPCDLAIFGPAQVIQMFPKQMYSLKKYNVGSLLIFSPWEGGFNTSPNLSQRTLQENLEIPVSVASQNELDSQFNDDVYYIHSCWLKPEMSWWPSQNYINFKNLKINKDPQFLFNFIIGTPRKYKIVLYNELIKSKLLDSNCLWINTDRRRIGHTTVKKNQLRGIIPYKNLNINDINSIPEELYDADKLCSLNEEQKIKTLNTLFCIINSKFSLVIESEMETKTNRYTEKTLKPISAGQPFIVSGNYQTLKLLKKDGFRTFHPYINENYDEEENPRKRISMIVDEIQRLKSLTKEDWGALNANIHDILEHNKKHLLNLKEKYFETLNNILV